MISCGLARTGQSDEHNKSFDAEIGAAILEESNTLMKDCPRKFLPTKKNAETSLSAGKYERLMKEFSYVQKLN